MCESFMMLMLCLYYHFPLISDFSWLIIASFAIDEFAQVFDGFSVSNPNLFCIVWDHDDVHNKSELLLL